MFFISFTTIITVILLWLQPLYFLVLALIQCHQQLLHSARWIHWGARIGIGVLHIGSYLCIWLLLERNNSPYLSLLLLYVPSLLYMLLMYIYQQKSRAATTSAGVLIKTVAVMGIDLFLGIGAYHSSQTSDSDEAWPILGIFAFMNFLTAYALARLSVSRKKDKSEIR